MIEIIPGGDKLIDEGAESLDTMRDRIDTDKMRAPSFLTVLTVVGDFAIDAEMWVCIVPLGCIKN